jgi:hypothetical protein
MHRRHPVASAKDDDAVACVDTLMECIDGFSFDIRHHARARPHPIPVGINPVALCFSQWESRSESAVQLVFRGVDGTEH